MTTANTRRRRRTKAEREQGRQHDADHQFHVWINRRQDERRAGGETTEHDLYEWKAVLAEVGRLPYWLHAARTGTLRQVHQQCSHQAPETIPAPNRVICALGVDVIGCPILRGLYEHFASEIEDRRRLPNPKARRIYRDIGLTLDDADPIAAKVCTWHIFTERQKNPGIDTSEGYVQDASARMFWDRVYESLSRHDSDEDDR